ncbi:MAG: peptide-methionine (S)-S-oxide reductase MsrA [Christensenellales bacterium]
MLREIYLAGGCYWGTEKFLASLQGVTDKSVLQLKAPSYDTVKHTETGHAETVHVTYDDKELPLEMLLELFYNIIDPTSLNKQGLDAGTQYRTGIYTVDDADLAVARRSLEKLQTRFDKPVVVECQPLDCFYTAEEYHQKYLDRNPNGYCHVSLGMIQKAKAWKPGDPTTL